MDEGRLRAGNAITQRGAVKPLLEGRETCPRSPAGHWLIGGASASGCSAEPAVSRGTHTTPDCKVRGIPGCMRVQTFKPQIFLFLQVAAPSELAESHAGPAGVSVMSRQWMERQRAGDDRNSGRDPHRPDRADQTHGAANDLGGPRRRRSVRQALPRSLGSWYRRAWQSGHGTRPWSLTAP